MGHESDTAQADGRAARKLAQRAARDAAAAAHESEKAAKQAAERERKSRDADSKNRRAEFKASRKASRAASKASSASAKAATAAAAAAATRPARLVTKLTDPKVAKRAVTIGKVLAPALAPVLLKAAAGTRRLLDERRARALGVPVDQVGAYRGPTGAAGARITGLSDSVRELAARKGNDLQVTRFAEVATARLRDLTAAVQASATMHKAKRNDVLRAVSRELDGIDADLVAHLMGPNH